LLSLGSGFSRGAAAVVLAVSFVASTSTAADLTGMWHIEYSAVTAELVDVSDAGGAVSLTLSSIPENGGIPTPFTGTLVGSTLDLTGICGGSNCSLKAKLVTGDGHFDGRLSIQGSSSKFRTFATRCECDDGNTIDGDGCDRSCRVEPCFTCTGTPSSCSPIPNGGSCSDHSECTTGDTCPAGICEGSPVAACVDFSGLWHQTDVSSGSTYEGSGYWAVESVWTCVPFDYDASGSRVCTNFGCFAPIPALTPALRNALPAQLSLASVRMLPRTL
jgi:cysteine-rich repeat protein